MNLGFPGGKDGGKGQLGSLKGHAHTPVFKMDNQQDVDNGNSTNSI